MSTDNSFQHKRPAIFINVPWLWPWVSSGMVLVILVTGWSLAAEALSRELLPGPMAIFQRLCHGWQTDPMITAVSGHPGGLGYHTLETVRRFLRFLSCGLASGSILLFVACLFTSSAKFLNLITWIANPIPPLLLLPVVHAGGCPTFMLEWIGGVFYPALAFLSIGLGTLGHEILPLEFLMKQAGAGRLWLAAHVRWPAMEAALLPALKTHGAFTFGLTVVIEWMLTPNGLGRVMKYALSFNNGTLLLSAVVLVVMVAAVYELLIQILVAVRLRWKIHAEDL